MGHFMADSILDLIPLGMGVTLLLALLFNPGFLINNVSDAGNVPISGFVFYGFFGFLFSGFGLWFIIHSKKPKVRIHFHRVRHTNH
jgi:hypothetical protein